MSRYKITLQYDGTNYFGWQYQPNVATVQGLLENVVKKVFKKNEQIKLHGSGRTDSGVHAWGQVAHIDLDTEMHVTDIKNALNANLPDDCNITSLEKVENNFHSRFDAKKRYYRYQCYTGHSLLFRNQCWMLPKLNLVILNRLAEKIIGTHNFLSFSKYRQEQLNTYCDIFYSRWSFEDNMFIFRISANRFLHHMIRYLVGTMIAVNEEQMTESEFQDRLQNPKKDVKIFKAPAGGLILDKIEYV